MEHREGKGEESVEREIRGAGDKRWFPWSCINKAVNTLHQWVAGTSMAECLLSSPGANRRPDLESKEEDSFCLVRSL